jgi:hypothetical protein
MPPKARHGKAKPGSSKEHEPEEKEVAMNIEIDARFKSMAEAFETRLATQRVAFEAEVRKSRKRKHASDSSDDEDGAVDGAAQDAPEFGAGVPENEWGDGARRA